MTPKLAFNKDLKSDNKVEKIRVYFDHWDEEHIITKNAWAEINNKIYYKHIYTNRDKNNG